MSDLVTIKTFQKVEEAYLAASFLESEDIDTAIQHEYSAQWVPFLATNASGGIALQVAEEDVPRAIELLQNPASAGAQS